MTCFNLIQGERMRLTRVDSCGNVVEGECSTVVSDGFVSVAMTDNVEDPEEFKQKNAAGRYCFTPMRGLPLLNWIDTTITFCEVDPELMELATASPIVVSDATPAEAVGFGTDSDTYASASFALEVWTNLPSEVCSGGEQQWGYLLLPWVLEGVIGDLTIENGPVSFEVKARTNGGNAWGVGPYDVINTVLGVPSPLLEAIPTTRHRHIQLTSLAPPDAACGCQALALSSS